MALINERDSDKHIQFKCVCTAVFIRQIDL